MSANSTKITATQIVAISAILADALESLPSDPGEPKHCRYRNGTTDASIAEAHGLHRWQVARLRQELFGQLVTRKGGPKPATDILELAGVVSKVALTLAHLAEKLGDHDIAKIARGLSQDATLAE